MLPANLFAQQYLSALRRAVTPEAWPYYLLRGPYAGVAAGVPYAATVDEIWPRALQEFVKTRLALYKYPRRVVFVAELPKNDRGKIDRRSLR